MSIIFKVHESTDLKGDFLRHVDLISRNINVDEYLFVSGKENRRQKIRRNIICIFLDNYHIDMLICHIMHISTILNETQCLRYIKEHKYCFVHRRSSNKFAKCSIPKWCEYYSSSTSSAWRQPFFPTFAIVTRWQCLKKWTPPIKVPKVKTPTFLSRRINSPTLICTETLICIETPINVEALI